MLLNCGIGEDSWESLGEQGDQTSQSGRKSVLNIHWKDWGWSWSSNTLATWWKELTHWKRPWCWEGLGAGGEGSDRRWDGWMAWPTQWTWVWASSRSWWWTVKIPESVAISFSRISSDPGVKLRFPAWQEGSLPSDKRAPNWARLSLQQCFKIQAQR